MTVAATATPMVPAAAAPISNPFHPVSDNASFSPVFQNSDAQNGSAFLGDLLTPEPANGSSQEVNQQDLFETNDTKDLSSSLARAAKSLGMASSASIMHVFFIGKWFIRK